MAVDDIARISPAASPTRQPMPSAMRREHDRAGRSHHLQAAHAEHGPAQFPQPGRAQFQADEKEHHHHAEFRDVHDLSAPSPSPTHPSADGPMAAPASR